MTTEPAYDAYDYARLVEQPDGPLKYIPEFGYEVRTFLDPMIEHVAVRSRQYGTLMHHVPVSIRGWYRPDQLDKEYRLALDPAKLVEDINGLVICTAKTKEYPPGTYFPTEEKRLRNGAPCTKPAQNRSLLCSTHGGGLHPMNKKAVEAGANNSVHRMGDVIRAEPERHTRWQRLLAGELSVDDLDDEELARGRCRASDGLFSGPDPKQVPKAMHDRMVKELFQRADNKLKENLLAVVDTMTDIAKGDAYEPADRIKAATWVFERLRGKAADVVIHTQEKPWEHVLTSIAGGSRAESRAARGIEAEQPIEAEWADFPTNVSAYDSANDAATSDVEDHAQGFGEDDGDQQQPQAGEPQDGHNTVDNDTGGSIPGGIVPGRDDLGRPRFFVDPFGSGIIPVGDMVDVGHSDGNVEGNETRAEVQQREGGPGLPGAQPGAQPGDGRTTGGSSGSVDEAASSRVEDTKALKERLKKAKGKRYASRARGMETVEVTPLVVKTAPAYKDGERMMKGGKALHTATFHDPVAPARYGKRGNPDMRHKI